MAVLLVFSSGLSSGPAVFTFARFPTVAYDRTILLGQTETMLYSAVGNAAQRTDFSGTITSYGYDPLNRLLTRTSNHANAAASNVAFTYTPSGQRQTMTDASGVTTYSYDPRDRLASKATPQGTLGYTYDAAGNLTSVTSSNANGTAVTYRYDELNRLEEVEDNGTEVTGYQYDEVGNLRSFATPNGVSHTYTYNALNRLSALTVARELTPLATYGYTQLRTGHRSRASESGTGVSPVNQPFTRSVTYQYDSLYRLTNESIAANTGPAGAVGYTHDPVGNRLTRTSTVAGLTAQTQSYDANDRLQSDTYDANGNTTAGQIALNAQGAETTPQTVADTYDAENRLATRTGPNSVQVIYDGDGNKVRETVNGQTISYLIDTQNLTGYAQVVEELQNGTVVRTYTYGHDLLVQDQRTGPGTWAATWYAYDGHGSVRALTDGAGQLTDRYDYDAFGQLLHSEGTTDNRYRYCGEQYDSALGLYYLRARYLNAANGRFWSMDSFEGLPRRPISLHKYLYAHNDPVNGNDPSGHFLDTSSFLEAQKISGELRATEAGLNIKRAAAVAAVVAFSVAVPSSEPVSRVRERKNVNAMRLQLQQGLYTHYWSKGYAYYEEIEPRWVHRSDIWGGLEDLYLAAENGDTDVPFPSRLLDPLYSAVIEMSKWVRAADSIGGLKRTVHQEYVVDRTEKVRNDWPRIDLEQISGHNFREMKRP